HRRDHFAPRQPGYGAWPPQEVRAAGTGWGPRPCRRGKAVGVHVRVPTAARHAARGIVEVFPDAGRSRVAAGSGGATGRGEVVGEAPAGHVRDVDAPAVEVVRRL